MSLDLSATATRLLNNLASADYVKLKRVSGAIFDPVTGTKTGGTTEIINLVAAVTAVPENLIDGTRVQVGDKMVLADNQTEILLTDVLIIPSDTGSDIEYRVIEVGGFNHAGIRQYYEVICRG